MARKPYISDDDWHKETDSKRRKQIQDRLAQRARRKSFPLMPQDFNGAHASNGWRLFYDVLGA